jgi:CelD/BcsL family acetyltransferase involved in cellulose biosynthesis
MFFSTELITTSGAFESLKPAWNELVDNMAVPEVFHRWEWNFNFFRRFRTAEQLFIILTRDPSGKLVGIAPLCIRRKHSLGRIVRVIETIIVNLGDYRNILVNADYPRDRVVKTMLDFLHVNGGQWDVIDLAQLSMREATTFHLQHVAKGFSDWTVQSSILSAVCVRMLKADRIAERTVKIRHIQNLLKRLEARGFQIRIRCDDFGDHWPTFCELHRIAWPQGPFHDTDSRQFYDDLRSSEGLKGRLEYSVVEFEGRPVAMHFGFLDGQKIYYYMPVMDREFRKERVGAVLLYAMIRHYEKTHMVFDFLRGLEGYKMLYTDELNANMRLVIYRSGSFAAFLHNAGELTRQYAIGLGLPKAAFKAASGALTRFRLGRRESIHR